MNRFNVYNTVKVNLQNQEFKEVSTKEVEVAKYLDTIHQVRLVKDIDTITLQQLVHLSGADIELGNVRNNQNEPTPLCK